MVPQLVLSDKNGNIYVHPTLKMLGSDGRNFCLPQNNETIPLPKDSSFFYMPGHAACGWDEKGRAFVVVKEFQGKEVYPVSAFMVPGFVRLYLPAARKLRKQITLPLWPYTAVGWLKGRFYVCAVKIDYARKHRPLDSAQESLMKRNIDRTLKKFPKSRLFKHLSRCAVVYNCPNARNLFLKRWEAPVPISPVCNSRCLGCLSFQESDCAVASHERIRFVPTPDEVVEVALTHLKVAREAIVSFGQGCEGEPLLQFPVLKKSIALLRRHVATGTIHLNTNGSHPSYLKELALNGLDSVRISLNSLNEKRYNAYYRPQGYSFGDVLTSIREAKENGLFVSLNLLMFPGFSDCEEEIASLAKFLKKGYVDLVQLRNLSIDPEFFITCMPFPKSRPRGIVSLIALLKKFSPKVRLGYFNLPKERFKL